MFNVTVRREFTARILLAGAHPGQETTQRKHDYILEAGFEGQVLDAHGYLIDITVVEEILDALAARWHNQLLNELPEFANINPTLENFTRIAVNQLVDMLPLERLAAVRVTLWESEKKPHPGPSATFRRLLRKE